MKILLVGGGSGGHITPLLAVANQLKSDDSSVKISIISEKRGIFNHMFEGARPIDDIYLINAGKYRRYYGRNLFRRIIDFESLILNVRDAFRIIFGLFESFILLIRIKPDVVFIKGGYVGVPVGLACRLLKKTYVTHDSDSVPGLTNKLIAKHAAMNMVGMPPAFYPYKTEKILFVGVPVTDDFIKPDNGLRSSTRKELDVSNDDFLLLITGGSNGAQRLDSVAHAALIELFETYPNLRLIHQVGKNNEKIYEDYPLKLHSRLRVSAFLKPLSRYILAADAVVARAGATSITEVGHLKKPLIVVPNTMLAGGHQSKNAEILENEQAAIIVNESQTLSDPSEMVKQLKLIIDNSEKRHKLAENLHRLTKTDANIKISKALRKLANQNNPISSKK